MSVTSNNNKEPLLAAIDLGSNSFRLEIDRFEHGQIQRVDYLKEAVRQGGDLDEDRNLTQEAIDRGLRCLARFGESIKGFPPERVRAVATQTLREAKNRDVFLKLAKKALGFEVEVISGKEEARLIYQGVSRMLPQSDEKRLVIDIGGRSTEFILGQHFDAKVTDSLRVGSVAWSLKYFSDGQLSERNFDRAEIAAESFLDMIADTYQSKHWDIAYGASGTVGAVADILSVAGFGNNIITSEGLTWLKHQLIKSKDIEHLMLNGLKDERKAVIGGGLSILLAVFDILKLDTLHVSNGALRHGLIFDMVAEEHTTGNLRENSIKGLKIRFGASNTQANNVAKVANHFFNLIAPSLSIFKNSTQELQKREQILNWAAHCHEIGTAISHNDSHRHGAYILENTELMGFAQSELHILSLLVLGHYGKIKKLDVNFKDNAFIYQLMALRLAVIFCHSRNTPVLKNILLARDETQFTLTLPSAWQKAFPQTCYLLEEEVLSWDKVGWKLKIESTD
jgi:exopolyphosphatase / guanosine-5'-triphosphate,3'-diphosphate pyrophosphatase